MYYISFITFLTIQIIGVYFQFLKVAASIDSQGMFICEYHFYVLVAET